MLLPNTDFERLEPHHIPHALKRTIRTETLTYPRTGLPRDPYALRPRHLDTARGVLDAAIEALDRRMGGALCHASGRGARDRSGVALGPTSGWRRSGHARRDGGETRGESVAQARNRRKASVAFVPPNPNPLERAASTWSLRAVLGT